MFNNFYKGKRVFITGHTGFKGSWLALWLHCLGAIVKGYALSPKTDKDMFVVTHLEDKIESVIGNILDKEELHFEMKTFQPDIVFHLAAQPIVKIGWDNPTDTYETNVIGTINVIEAAMDCESVKQFINVTTDKVYLNIGKKEGYTEEDELGGDDPYSISKVCSEHISKGYESICGFNLITVRAGNVIGGGDWSEYRLVPDILRGVYIRNPNHIRPWQHVLDCLSGYLQVASSYRGGAWNFGPRNEQITVITLAAKLKGPHKLLPIEDTKSLVEFESPILQLDCTKAKNHLDWEPTLDIDETVKFTENWYRIIGKNLLSPKEVYAYSTTQLLLYIDLAKKRGLRWTK